MNRASPADLRKALQMARTLADAGIGFICIPVLSADDHNELVEMAAVRLETLALEAEANEKA